jgi:curved DNA-binding protein
VERGAKFSEIKKEYFRLAKKYHPDLNQNNEHANKMFILIGDAYRQIEVEYNPLLREARKKAAQSYDNSFNEKMNEAFKSRRAE